MKYEMVYDCECGVQTKLTLKRPLRVGQILGCLSCGRRFRLTPVVGDEPGDSQRAVLAKSLEGKLAEVSTWACCEWPARAIRAEDALSDMESSRDWYRIRLYQMQRWMTTLPEPYRTECAAILANGKIEPWVSSRLTQLQANADGEG